MELRFDEVFGEINIEHPFEKNVKITFVRFVKEVIGSVLTLSPEIILVLALSNELNSKISSPKKYP